MRLLGALKDTDHARCRTQGLASSYCLEKRSSLHYPLTPTLGGEPLLYHYCRASFPPTALAQVWITLYLLRKMRSREKQNRRKKQKARKKWALKTGMKGARERCRERVYFLNETVHDKVELLFSGLPHFSLEPTEIPH